MIRINLAPDEEIENKLWWLPLVIGVVVVYLLSSYAVEFYQEDIKMRITSLEAEAEEHRRGYRELKSKQDEFLARDKERDDLQNRLASLQRITESKILRYRPVILLEHLQNLKPEGIWFSKVSLLKTTIEEEPVPEPVPVAEGADPATAPKTEPEGELTPEDKLMNRINKEADQHEITITGRAFDNILVAEFLSALKSTQSQEVDPTSLRTMVYFSEITLKQSVLATETLISAQLPPADEALREQPQQPAGLFNQAGVPGRRNQNAANDENKKGESVAEFEITLKFREHPSPIRNSAMETFSFKPLLNKRFTMY